jgi:hypothetical protein
MDPDLQERRGVRLAVQAEEGELIGPLDRSLCYKGVGLILIAGPGNQGSIFFKRFMPPADFHSGFVEDS